MDRKKKLLALLIVVWGLLIVYRVAQQEEPKRVPLTYVKGQTVSREAVRTRGQTGEVRVRLDLLEGRSQVGLNKARNIFAPIRVYVPPPPPPPVIPVPVPPPPPTPEEMAREQARRALAQFRYLGYLDKGGGRDQAFLARNQELYIVNRGQTIDGSIYLKDLTSNYVILQERITQIEMTLSISGS